ncbi:hypothetical protein I302_108817 [Kwoniella bestiolae CBS 10118]|uniref:Uncharacterized protein n=1 Tax=Kwoniella bestiolae CBS 10118 TaxID=1296100 RepID=A0A1B9FU60_9TREE|nr:hypothetical protein I302_07955 [Kwoniella bestiolae CBS 10118]OCF22309.1 hypothetical protein I302_07955 [Kwoniella bestiolae CBS 10118]
MTCGEEIFNNVPSQIDRSSMMDIAGPRELGTVHLEDMHDEGTGTSKPGHVILRREIEKFLCNATTADTALAKTGAFHPVEVRVSKRTDVGLGTDTLDENFHCFYDWKDGIDDEGNKNGFGGTGSKSLSELAESQDDLDNLLAERIRSRFGSELDTVDPLQEALDLVENVLTVLEASVMEDVRHLSLVS